MCWWVCAWRNVHGICTLVHTTREASPSKTCTHMSMPWKRAAMGLDRCVCMCVCVRVHTCVCMCEHRYRYTYRYDIDVSHINVGERREGGRGGCPGPALSARDNVQRARDCRGHSAGHMHGDPLPAWSSVSDRCAHRHEFIAGGVLAETHASTFRTQSHTHMETRTHARARAHTHTHTHTCMHAQVCWHAHSKIRRYIQFYPRT